MGDISAEFSFQKRSDFQNLCSTDGVLKISVHFIIC